MKVKADREESSPYAAMSLVLMILIFICVAVMNRFGEGDGEEVIKV